LQNQEVGSLGRKEFVRNRSCGVGSRSRHSMDCQERFPTAQEDGGVRAGALTHTY